MSDLRFPQFFRARQTFPRPRVSNVRAKVHAELGRIGLGRTVRAGDRVAVTAGSRGISEIPVILRSVVDYLIGLGAEPFIVPAMGSHGGASSTGQVALLARYGITEEACGCPIRSSMDTAVLGQAPEGFAVHFDAHALEADHVLICGRIKPHTQIAGSLQSGLAKMMLVGLGKHAGAQIYHRAFHDLGFERVVRSVAPIIFGTGKIAAGLAIVENAYGDTAHVEAIPPAELFDRERELLVLAKELMPRLPFDDVDLLVVDEIGKNISGTGMDTNVIGRKSSDHGGDVAETPRIKRILVRGLSAETAGNATGIGLAEFTTHRAAAQIDAEATRVNCLASGHVTAGMLPMSFVSDAEAIGAALSIIGLIEPAQARVLWIRSTAQLEEVECSAAYLDAAQRSSQLTASCELRALPFDTRGDLPLEGVLAMRSLA